jgi:hypothetical protein
MIVSGNVRHPTLTPILQPVMTVIPICGLRQDASKSVHPDKERDYADPSRG